MSMPGHRPRMPDRRSGGWWPADGVAMHGGDVAMPACHVGGVVLSTCGAPRAHHGLGLGCRMGGHLVPVLATYGPPRAGSCN
jgi:hypothetical protein